MAHAELTHSEEIQQELENCRRFLNDAQDRDDAARVMSILRVFTQLHRDIEKARIREGLYLDAKAVAAHDAAFLADVIDKLKGYMQRLYDQAITPEAAWEELVDEIIGGINA